MRWLALWVLAGCSYHGSPANTGDGPGDDAPAGEDAIDIDTALAPCNYDEAADGTNNTSANAEPTNLTFAAPTVLCGNINSATDVDAYKFTVGATTDVAMHITAPGAEALDRVVIQILDDTGGTQLGFGVFTGTHGTLLAHLPAGDYIAGVAASNGSAIAAPLSYRLEIRADNPAQRCIKGSAVQHTFVEANDGGSNTGNDMITIDEALAVPRKLTTGNDVPEPAGPSDPTLRVSGSSENVNINDDYQDRDTFEFTTGAATNQLSVRLDWPASATDLDFVVFKQGTVISIGSGLRSSLTEDEFDTFAVEPSTAYWLWIGGFDGSATPASYDATICNELFTP